jgi:hypothetical protein
MHQLFPNQKHLAEARDLPIQQQKKRVEAIDFIRVFLTQASCQKAV